MSRRALGSITEISPGVFRVQVSAGIDPVTGQRRRLTRVVRGLRKDAEAALAKMLLEVGQMPETAVTVQQYLDSMYLPHIEGRVRVRTYDDYKSKIENHITPTLGDVAMNELTPYRLDAWLDGVQGSEQTRLHVYRVLCSALNLAVRWRLIPHNPINAVEPPKVRREMPDTLTVKEAQAYLTAFRGHALEPIVVMALAAGLRRSELAGLQWSDIDFTNKTVHIQRGLHDRHGEVVVEETKSATSNRVVALPEWSVAVLEPLRALGPLVVEDGAAMKPWRISKLYSERLAEKKLRRIQLKNLRHSHATLMLASGVDLYTVSRRLGHSTVAITEKHYVKPGEAADRAAADAFNLSVPVATIGATE
jgi:integrase